MCKVKYLITLKTLQKKIYNKLCHDSYGLVLREGFISKLGAMPEGTRSLYLNKMASSDMIPFFSQSTSSQYHHQPKEDYFSDMKKVCACNAIQRMIILNAIFNQTNRSKSAIISEQELRKMLDKFNFDETIDIALGLKIPLESEHLVLKHVNLKPGKRVVLEPAITAASIGGTEWKPQKRELDYRYHYHQNLGNHFFVGLIALLVASKMIILNHDKKKKTNLGVIPLPVANLDTMSSENIEIKTDLEQMKEHIATENGIDAMIENTASRSIPVIVPHKLPEHDHWMMIDHVAVPIEVEEKPEIVFPSSLRFGGNLLERLKREYNVCQYVVLDPLPE